jgi:hypothetical protein
LISGEVDPITPSDQAQIAAEALPQSRHVILANTGHTGAANTCATGMVAQMVDRADANQIDTACAQATASPRFTAPMPEPLRPPR